MTLIINGARALAGAALIASFAWAPSAAAEDGGHLSNIYLGIGGSAVFGDGCEDVNCSDSFNDWTVGVRGTAGYQFNDWIAAELGAHYLGTIDDPDISDTDDFTGQALSLSLLAQTTPRNDISLFGRIGGAYGRIEETDGDPAIADESDSGGAFLVGAGFNLDLGGSARLRGEVEYMGGLGEDEPAGEVDYLMFSVSVLFGL